MARSTLCVQLFVILWKNCVLRKYHWLLTIIEIIVPVCLFVFIGYARSTIPEIQRTYISTPTYSEIRESKDIYYNTFDNQMKIYYSPDTSFSSRLMENVQLTFSLPYDSVVSFKSETELLNYYKQNSEGETGVMAVIFNNLKGEEVPKQLDYIIRPYEKSVNWETDRLYSSNDDYMTGMGSETYMTKSFMALKMALDTSFVKMTIGQDSISYVMQEFPYPSHYQDTGMKDMFSALFPLMTVISFVFLCPAVVKRVVEDKSTGITELMKMMGLKSWMLWLGWLLHAFSVNLISICIITITVKEKFGSEFPVIEFCNGFLFFWFLLLYVSASITFFFAISSFFSKPTIAMVIGILIWFLSQLLPSGLVSTPMRWYKKLLWCILPNMGLNYGYLTMNVFERRRIAANWNNLFESPAGGEDDISMGQIFIMFIFDIIFYMLITFYVEAVNPGPYGLARPYSFPITCISDYCLKKSGRIIHKIDETEALQEYSVVELAPNLVPGIQIQNLYKKFGKFSVINGLSLDIYEGQITALLGHNGAGKTTTMSIITGLIGATSGRILINSKDIKTHMNEVRNSLGLCPQHNLHFNDLTAIQHLIFFGMLKGMSRSAATAEGEMLLSRMNILQKKNCLASNLSGGMQRKLSLGISLIGNSKVVILDEPTSGLDPESRREIWDILLSLRGSRTILITTHFMEEADVLGDRIAIMDHGRLMCYGTSMFLKKEFGAGYHLSLIRDTNTVISNQVTELTKIVNSVIPNAVLHAHAANYITFLLPYDAKSSFSSLFEKIEKSKASLGISNISLSITTLEEVFLRVGNIALTVDRTLSSPQLGTVSSTSSFSSTSVKSTGNKKIMLQTTSLIKKRFLVARKRLCAFLLPVFLTALITLFTLYLGDSASGNQSSVTLTGISFNLDAYSNTKVFYSGMTTDTQLSQIMEQYKKLVQQQLGNAINVSSVSDAILTEGTKNIEFYNNHMIVAAEFNRTKSNMVINAMYSSKALHGAPISFNLVINAVLRGIKGEEYSIKSSNYPLIGTDNPNMEEASIADVATAWLLLFPLGMLFLTSTFVVFPQVERATNIKQIQLMCGIRSLLYWGTCYVCDLGLYFAAVVIIIFVTCVYGLLFPNVISGSNEISTLLVILVVYGISVIPCAYLFSYMKTAAGAFASFLLCSLFISVIMSIVVGFLLMKEDDTTGKLLESIMYLFPHFGLTYSCLRFSQQAVQNYNWKVMSPDKKSILCTYSPKPCCAGDNTPQCIQSQAYIFDENALGPCLLQMLLSTVIYFTILLILETNFIYGLWDKFCMIIYNQINKIKSTDAVDGAGDNDVFCESQRVYDTLKKEKTRKPEKTIDDEETDLLLVHNLQKIYGRQKVVKGISFGVKPGDCFGLLGVNGAGKTTTFRMLTGDQPVVNGEVRIFSGNQVAYISKQTNKYLENLGYCPQFDPISEVLTGREMLRFFAQFRGISEGIEEEVNMWLQALGLEEFADKPCGNYSGGNKRKLCIAMALIGGPSLVMLDEPTSGVDPISRRKLWDTITAVQSQVPKPSVILTSHSMEECEVLCNKLAIMKAGKLECYGTIPNLKEKYGEGFTVMLKLKVNLVNIVINPLSQDDAQSTASQSRPLTASPTHKKSVASNPTVEDDSLEVKNLMTAFEDKYKGFCRLRDKHTGMLHYHINDKAKKWSVLFKDIEQLKQQHSIIEDYNISETTLEEVFLSIARSEEQV